MHFLLDFTIVSLSRAINKGDNTSQINVKAKKLIKAVYTKASLLSRKGYMGQNPSAHPFLHLLSARGKKHLVKKEINVLPKESLSILLWLLLCPCC